MKGQKIGISLAAAAGLFGIVRLSQAANEMNATFQAQEKLTASIVDRAAAEAFNRTRQLATGTVAFVARPSASNGFMTISAARAEQVLITDQVPTTYGDKRWTRCARIEVLFQKTGAYPETVDGIDPLLQQARTPPPGTAATHISLAPFLKDRLIRGTAPHALARLPQSARSLFDPRVSWESKTGATPFDVTLARFAPKDGTVIPRLSAMHASRIVCATETGTPEVRVHSESQPLFFRRPTGETFVNTTHLPSFGHQQTYIQFAN